MIGTAEASRPERAASGATYLHRGITNELDLAAKRALARRVPNRYYTRPRVETDVEILEGIEERELANGATLHWGRVRTTDSVTFYKKVRVADDREVGVYPLDLPDVILETQAFWVTLPPLPRGARPSFESFGGALHAGEHGMIGLLPLFAMCDRADIGGLSTPIHRQTTLPTIFVYDGYPGGVGISRRGYDAFASLARDTLGVITRCPCESGCPACIQSPKCGNWNEPPEQGRRRLPPALPAWPGGPLPDAVNPAPYVSVVGSGEAPASSTRRPGRSAGSSPRGRHR